VTNERETAGRRRAPWPLLVLLLVFVGPLAGAWLLFDRVDVWRPPSDHYGTLVVPARPLEEYAAALPAALAPEALRGHWTLLLLAPAPHDAAGARLVHDLRQLHVALGKHSDRVRRLVVTDGGAAAPVATPQQDPYLEVVVADRDALARLGARLAGTADTGRALYLVDPLGNLMMRYPLPAAPQGVLADLRRLLRSSRLG
jgi:hypothetical protein